MAGVNQKTNSKADSGDEEIISFGIIGGIAVVGLVILIQYASVGARYLYAPFAMPAWVGGVSGGTAGAVAAILLIAGALAAVWAVRFFLLKKKGFFWLSYAGLFVFLALLEMSTGFDNSLLTKHVSLFCNPSTPSVLGVFSCQHTAADLASVGTLNLITWSIVPNFVLAWPIFYIVVSGVFRVATEHPFLRMSRTHNIDSLIKEQKSQFSHLLFFDLVNPLNLPNSDGQLRMMDGSRRFCFENDLVSNFTIRPDIADSSNFGRQFGETPVSPDLSYYDFKKNDLVPVLDADLFERLMNKQLGEPWAGVENLEPAETIILAMALPRACCLDESMSTKEANAVKEDGVRKVDEVWKWVAQDISSAESDVDNGLADFPKLEEYRAEIERWINHDISQDILRRHAYVRTVLYKTLNEAKKIGVMQPSMVRWLKYYNREVWAVIQNVSRPSSFAENIAVVAHYKEETREGTAINRPMFQAAYNGLVERAREFSYSEEAVISWHEWKTEGDATGLAKLSLISRERAEALGVDLDEDEEE